MKARYTILNEDYMSVLSDRVEEYLERGYVPVGGVYYHEDRGYFQAMMLPKEETK